MNDTLWHFAHDGLPFGGVGASGSGPTTARRRFRTFTHEKPVFVQNRDSPPRSCCIRPTARCSTRCWRCRQAPWRLTLRVAANRPYAREKVADGARHDVRRAAQVLEQQVLVRPLGVRFADRARPGAIHDDRHAVLAVEARVGVERHADGRDVFAEHALARASAIAATSFSCPGQRLQRTGEQQAPDLDADAVVAARPRASISARTRASTSAGSSSGIIRRSIRSVEPVGHDVGVDAAVDQADDHRRMVDARDARLAAPSAHRLRRRCAFRIAVPARNASRPVSGIAPWPDLPCTVTSNCRQPLCAVTTA